jgi:hypothetical protein
MAISHRIPRPISDSCQSFPQPSETSHLPVAQRPIEAAQRTHADRCPSRCHTLFDISHHEAAARAFSISCMACDSSTDICSASFASASRPAGEDIASSPVSAWRSVARTFS